MNHNEEEGLGERAINAAAKLAVSSQFGEYEELQVSVHTDPSRLVTGELDSVQISGQGLVMQQELRMETLDIETGKISVNPMLAAFGNVQLQEATEAKVFVVLTEQDLNGAFDADYIQEKLQSFPITVDGQSLTLDVQHVDFSLPGEGKVKLDVAVLFRETGETRHVEFTAVPEAQANGKGAILKQVQYLSGKEISPEMTNELIKKSEYLLNISNFDFSSGMSVKLEALQVEVGQIHLHAQAHIEEIPS